MIVRQEPYTLDQYITHEKYKFIYTHPVYLKHAQKSGFFLSCVNEEAEEGFIFSIRALIITGFLIMAAFFGASIRDVCSVPEILTITVFFSVFIPLLFFKDFIYTRKSLWVKLEKEFMKEKVKDLQMEKIAQALTSYQKSVFWIMLGTHKKNIDFNDIVNVVKETNDHINREKLINILRK